MDIFDDEQLAGGGYGLAAIAQNPQAVLVAPMFNNVSQLRGDALRLLGVSSSPTYP